MQTLILLLTLLNPPKIPYKAIIPQVKVITFEATAYTSNDAGMNGKGITASGKKAIPWRTVAASRGIPFGAKIYIAKLDKTFVVEDRGYAIKGNELDLYIGDRKTALKFGRRKLKGFIVN